MAAYDELFDLGNDTSMKNKVAMAATVKAHVISGMHRPTQLQLDWAIAAFTNPIPVANTLWCAILGGHSTELCEDIKNMSDEGIQTSVDYAVDNCFTKEPSNVNPPV